MAAVSKLYNPFRDEKKAKAAGSSPTKSEQSDPFADFSFEIQPEDADVVDHVAVKDKTETDPQHPEFDPFHIHVAEKKKKKKKKGKHSNNATTTGATSTAPRPITITPKLVVRLSTQEEVTSRVKMAMDEFDVSSEITVEGTVYAQVQCSDAKKNAPFALLVPHVPGFDHTFSMQPNEKYAVAKTSSEVANVPLLVTVPKQDILAVPIASYSLKKQVKFMPVLVERKITRNGGRVRIAIQIRSRLDNLGDMKDMTILVAVPEKVNGSTISIVRGDGVWEGLKRTIKWKVPDLLKGQSELVIAEADLWKTPAPGEDETPFPIMFRCSSVADPISPLEWKLAQVSGTPSQLTVPSVDHSFRLLHRLP